MGEEGPCCPIILSKSEFIPFQKEKKATLIQM